MHTIQQDRPIVTPPTPRPVRVLCLAAILAPGLVIHSACAPTRSAVEPLPVPPSAATPDLALDIADDYFQMQLWSEAAAAYARVLEAPDPPAIAYYRHGYSLHAAGRFEEAAAAHARAARFPAQRAEALYNLACARSRLGRNDEALEALQQSFDAGFNTQWLLKIDADLDPLRDDPRFVSMVEALRLKLTVRPCDRPEGDQFDFWLGEWEIAEPGQSARGTMRVSKVLGQCTVHEKSEWPDGTHAQSWSQFIPATGRWRHVRIDDSGAFQTFSGEWIGNQMMLDEDIAPNARSFRRVRWHTLREGSFGWVLEQTFDGGREWHPVREATLTHTPVTDDSSPPQR